jgi:hypothetical protein
VAAHGGPLLKQRPLLVGQSGKHFLRVIVPDGSDVVVTSEEVRVACAASCC